MKQSLAASLALVVAAAWPAFAAEPQATTEMRQVSIAGLDLSRAEDQAALRHRLALAAQRVCGAAEVEGLYDSDAYLGCYTDAIRQALAEADTRIALAVSRARLASAR